MAIFQCRATVANPTTNRSSPVEFMVDTGSTYIWLPEDLLNKLGVEASVKRRVKLATGQTIERSAGVVLLTLNGEMLPILCIFGDSGSEPLLGSMALETFSLAADPVNKRLVPTVSYSAAGRHVRAQRGDARRESNRRPRGQSALRSLIAWARAKRPVIMFVVLFAVLMGAFYAVTFIPFVQKKIIPVYMRANAQVSAVVLNVFGEGAKASGTSVTSSRYSVNILHGCDAIEPSALFLAAVLAFPASMRSKLPGLVVGTLVLAIINLVRIVTLFYTGIYRPKWFEAMHVDVWQPVFILLALTFWVMWAWWATRGTTLQPDVSAQTD